jgi:hypothetical protein
LLSNFQIEFNNGHLLNIINLPTPDGSSMFYMQMWVKEPEGTTVDFDLPLMVETLRSLQEAQGLNTGVADVPDPYGMYNKVGEMLSKGSATFDFQNPFNYRDIIKSVNQSDAGVTLTQREIEINTGEVVPPEPPKPEIKVLKPEPKPVVNPIQPVPSLSQVKLTEDDIKRIKEATTYTPNYDESE